MTRDLEASLRWAAAGTTLFLETLDGLDDAQLDGPSGLPGWTRRHLVAHVAANAEALENLVTWAVTGIETPMYASAEARARGLDVGAAKPAEELRAWLSRACAELATGLGDLTPEQWESPVRTARGSAVTATEIPWLRAREVWIHAVDLDAGVTFQHLPPDFQEELIADVVAQRSGQSGHPAMLLLAMNTGMGWKVNGEGEEIQIRGSQAALAAWLTGRPAPSIKAPAPSIKAVGGEVPILPTWL